MRQPLTTRGRRNSSQHVDRSLCCDYFAPGSGAKYCDQRVCLYVCVSVRLNISKTTRPNFTKFFSTLPVPVARSSPGDKAIRYVLPILWMSLCFTQYGICGARLVLRPISVSRQRKAMKRGRSFSASASPISVLPR